ncbi:MAG: hypothetical protein WKF47_09685, partial [Geodermatophilaceae bacterium]
MMKGQRRPAPVSKKQAEKLAILLDAVGCDSDHRCRAGVAGVAVRFRGGDRPEHRRRDPPGEGLMSTPDEAFRATLAGRTADGADNTLIVTCQAGQVWLTLLQNMSTTVVLTDDETDRLIALLRRAKGAA